MARRTKTRIAKTAHAAVFNWKFLYINCLVQSFIDYQSTHYAVFFIAWFVFVGLSAIKFVLWVARPQKRGHRL